MKNEDAFNAYLSKEMKRLAPQLVSFKMAEKFHIGVPDFMLVSEGRAAFFESKFLKEEPKGNGKVLGHPFSGPQMAFLRTMARAGCPAYGVIGQGYRGRIKVISVEDLPQSGNWNLAEWVAVRAHFFSMAKVADLAHFLMNGSGKSEDLHEA